MLNLIKSIFYANRKNGFFLASIIVIGVFAIIDVVTSSLSNSFLYELAEQDPNTYEAFISLGISINAKSLYMAAVGNTSTASLILVIFVIIMITNDFKFGSIRSKIISGNSKFSTFISMFICAEIYVVSFLVAYALVVLLLGSLVCGYGPTFTGSELLFLLEWLLFGIILNTFSISSAVFISMIFQTTGRSILLYLLISVALSMFDTIFTIIGMANPNLEMVTDTINYLNPSNFSTAVVSMNMSVKMAVMGSISTAIYSVGFIFGGAAIFGNCEIK